MATDAIGSLQAAATATSNAAVAGSTAAASALIAAPTSAGTCSLPIAGPLLSDLLDMCVHTWGALAALHA